LIGRNPVNLIVSWCGQFLFFIVPRQFSQDIGEWPENQILIPDWTYFHCPGATLVCGQFLFFVVSPQFSQDISKWPENQILIPDWAHFHCPGTTQVHGVTHPGQCLTSKSWEWLHLEHPLQKKKKKKKPGGLIPPQTCSQSRCHQWFMKYANSFSITDHSLSATVGEWLP